MTASDSVSALRATYAWFDVNTGWAPPDPEELAEWLADGVCKSPDDCLVAPGEACAHGLMSWDAVLADTEKRGA